MLIDYNYLLTFSKHRSPKYLEPLSSTYESLGQKVNNSNYVLTYSEKNQLND